MTSFWAFISSSNSRKNALLPNEVGFVLAGMFEMKSLVFACLAVLLTACASSDVITDYATTYKLLDIRGSIVNHETGSKIVALAVYENTNVLAPVGVHSGLTVSRNDEVEIYVVVGLALSAMGTPDIKVIVDDQGSSGVLASKLFSNVRLEGKNQQKTLVVRVPHAACKSLRITVLGSPAELRLEGMSRGVRMLSLCR